MSKFTKTESTQAMRKLLKETEYMETNEVVENFTNATYNTDEHYTLAIEPEVYTEDGETFIYLNVVLLTRSARAILFNVEGGSVEIGRYNDDDEKTINKACGKALKEAKKFDLYVTELV